MLPVVVENNCLILTPFPSDDELPALREFFDNNREPSLLERLMGSSIPQDSVSVVPLRYKPERRFVARVDLNGVPFGVTRLHSENGYTQSRRASKSLGPTDSIRLPDVLGHSDRHRALLHDLVRH